MTNRKYLVALSSFVPFGPARIKLLVKYFGSAKKAWNVSRKDLIKVGLNEKVINQFIKYRDNARIIINL